VQFSCIMCHQLSRSAKVSVSALSSTRRYHSASKSCAPSSSSKLVVVGEHLPQLRGVLGVGVTGGARGMAAAERIACHLHIEVVFLRAVDRVVDEGVGRVVPTIVTAAITVVVVGTLCSIVHETTHVHHVDLCPTAVSRAPRHTVSADGDDRR
jgi:hypothetical protein